MVNPNLVAIRRRAHEAANPPEEVAFQRNLKLLVRPDGFGRAERIMGFLPPQTIPALDAEQVTVDGVDYDDLQALLTALNDISTTLAGLGFITKGPETELDNEFALASLATGLLKNTTTTGIPTIAVPGTDYAPAMLTATATLDFPSIAAQTCEGMDITVTGAAVGKGVIVGAPAGIEAGLTWSGRVSATDTVRIRLCNISASPIDPASASWTVWVVSN